MNTFIDEDNHNDFSGSDFRGSKINASMLKTAGLLTVTLAMPKSKRAVSRMQRWMAQTSQVRYLITVPLASPRLLVPSGIERDSSTS